MAETVCPDGRNWNGHFQDRGQRPRQTRSSGVHSTLLGRRNRLKVAGLGVPSGLAQGATSTRSLKHSSAVAGGLRHHTYVAGASSRQGRGGVELQVPSRLRHGVSPYRLLARRKLRQGVSSIARHRQPLHSNDSCHGKPTTDRSSTSHPKNSLNLQQHRRPSPFLHTTQLSGSSLPRTNRILVSVPTPIQRNRTSCDQTLRLPQVSHPNRQDVEYSRPHVRRPGKTLSGCQFWTGWSLLVPASRFNIPSPPIPMAAVDEPSSPKPTTYLTTAEPIIWLTTTANS